jgi:hypothetical protein
MTNESTVVIVSKPPGWYIAYKRGDGRVIAYPTTFATKELAQRKLDEAGKNVTPPTDFNSFMHVVEVGK